MLKLLKLRVLLEGELAFANIIKTVLEKGIGNRDGIFSAEIGGCVYLNKEKDKLVESFINRIDVLDSIKQFFPMMTGPLILEPVFINEFSPSINDPSTETSSSFSP